MRFCAPPEGLDEQLNVISRNQSLPAQEVIEAERSETRKSATLLFASGEVIESICQHQQKNQELLNAFLNAAHPKRNTSYLARAMRVNEAVSHMESETDDLEPDGSIVSDYPSIPSCIGIPTIGFTERRQDGKNIMSKVMPSSKGKDDVKTKGSDTGNESCLRIRRARQTKEKLSNKTNRHDSCIGLRPTRHHASVRQSRRSSLKKREVK
jgi:hypothetical protein